MLVVTVKGLIDGDVMKHEAGIAFELEATKMLTHSLRHAKKAKCAGLHAKHALRIFVRQPSCHRPSLAIVSNKFV